MPQTAELDLRYPSGASDANVPLDLENLADDVETYFTGITGGKAFVANASGVMVPQTISGDITLSNAGSAQIASGAVGTAELASSAITNAKIGDGEIANAKLASPTAGVYRTLFVQAANVAAASTGSYMFQAGGTQAGSPASTSGTPVPVLDLVATEQAVSGLTTKVRVKQVVSVGSTSPGSTVLTAGLYPLTISGGSFTLGTVVSGSTAASSSLSTNGTFSFNSGDLTIPSDGRYVLGIAVSGATVPAGIQSTLQLQARNV